jgi:hypothetical protein
MRPTPKSKSFRFKRLLKHLEYINETEPEVFDLDTFVNHNAHPQFTTLWPRALRAKKPLNCGTTACIIGHMPLIFKEFMWHDGYVKSRTGTTTRESACADFFGGTSDAWQGIIYNVHYATDDPPLEEVLERLHTLYTNLYPKP